MSKEFHGKAIIPIFLAISAVLLASGCILILSEWFRTLLGFVACLAGLMISLCRRDATWYNVLGLAALLLAAVYAIFRLDWAVYRLVGLSWLFVFIHFVESYWLGRQRSGQGARWLLLHWATLGFAGLLLWYEHSDRIWFITRTIGDPIGSSHTSIGAWVSGFPIYVLGLLIVTSAAIIGPQRRQAIKYILILCAGFPVGRAILSMPQSIEAHHVSIHQLATVGFVSIVVALAERKRAIGLSQLRKAGRLLIGASLTVVVLMCGLQLADIPACPAGPCAVRPSFALYSQGLLDWNLPDLDRLGLANSGMFGLFRKSLERHAREIGGEVMLVDSLGGHDLSRVGVLVFINPTGTLSDRDVALLERFVNSGGGLLVLGDHTDIGGSRGRLNTVLSFTAMRFNFDSAMPLRKHWRGCLEIRRHPVTSRTVNHVMLQMAVGASLKIEEPAFPLLVARYGFSDKGDRLNGGIGAYMGNGSHERGERIGDIVLAAGQHIGRGKVIAFGDTSPFQNGAIFVSQRLVSDVVTWLTGGDQGGRDNALHGSQLSFGDQAAIIDFSLKPHANLEPFTQTSLGGLANCLARAGVSAGCALSNDEWTQDAAYLFLIGPTRRLKEHEKTRLLDYTYAGGNLIFCQGYVSPQPCRNLLSDLGLSIRPVPLGDGGSPAPVSHKDAWWVSYLGEADTSLLATAFDCPTIVMIPHGKGTFTMVGDGRLLLDENLESEFTGNLDNISFVTDLVEGLRCRKDHGIASRH